MLSEDAVKELDPEVFYEKCLPITRRFMIEPSLWDKIMAFGNRLLFMLRKLYQRFKHR